jgi:acetate kinase
MNTPIEYTIVAVPFHVDAATHNELARKVNEKLRGGCELYGPSFLSEEMVEELRQLTPFDPEHLSEEILSPEAFHRCFTDLPQVACFDTAFHHDLPRVARLVLIPRRCEALGVRRYGFHGL